MMIAERLERRHQAEAYRKHRLQYLPGQIEATRQKLQALHREAIRLGMPHLVPADELLEDPKCASDALEDEVASLRP